MLTGGISLNIKLKGLSSIDEIDLKKHKNTSLKTRNATAIYLW